MTEHAVNFKNLLAYFGGAISFVREERSEMLAQMEEEHGDAFYQKMILFMIMMEMRMN